MGWPHVRSDHLTWRSRGQETQGTKLSKMIRTASYSLLSVGASALGAMVPNMVLLLGPSLIHQGRVTGRFSLAALAPVGSCDVMTSNLSLQTWGGKWVAVIRPENRTSGEMLDSIVSPV